MIIKSYIKTLSKFIEILTKNEKIDIEYILTRISKNLKLESFKKNTFLMKIGELGNNFYVILKGKVGVLVPKHFEVIMTKKQYLNHLKLLQNFEEYYLLNSTLVKFGIFPALIKGINAYNIMTYDIEILLPSLDIIMNILKNGEILSFLGRNSYLLNFEKLGGKEILEKLLGNPNDEVYKKTDIILSTFFENKIN